MNAKKNRKSFLLLLAGQTVSQMGSSMTGFAAVIWAYSQTGEALASSLLAVCNAVPYLVVSLLGGAVADRLNKKKVMLCCDALAAAGSLLLLLCLLSGSLRLWILCAVNVLGGFMNAFQNPASQVAVSLLVEKEDYVRAGGLQSAAGSLSGMFNPVLAAAALGLGGLRLVLLIDLGTFLFAFLSLLLFVRIPEEEKGQDAPTFREIWKGMREGMAFLKQKRELLMLLIAYSVLEFMGAISFDGMFSPLILARTGNDEMALGIVSSAMAAGCVAGSLAMTLVRQPAKKVPPMFLGSLTCLTGIVLFGVGRSVPWWCVVVFCGCFGAPVYHTFQTAILRERVPVSLQGRMFALQGMLTEMLAPVGYLGGALLADHVFEPFMRSDGRLPELAGRLVGRGPGSGIGLIFVLAGLTGMVLLFLLWRVSGLRKLDEA